MSAFDRLMQKKPKRKRPSPFIDCPAGCGARLLEREVNQHLDKCLNSDEHQVEKKQDVPSLSGAEPAATKAKKTLKASPQRVICPSCQKVLPQSIINLHLDHCTSRSPAKKQEVPHGDKQSPQLAFTTRDGTTEASSFSQTASLSPGEQDRKPLPNRVSQSPPRTAEPDATGNTEAEQPRGSNIFTKMMENSKKAFASLDGLADNIVTQSFHLNADNQVTLRLSTLPINEVLLSSRWSAMVTVKDKCEQESPPLLFEVHLSSSVSCDPVTRRWVRQHSRLSIPVLKSLLQKSIRRRRPLDSVRIAMEIADKALDELLRRLPIIVLEDSTLHDDLSFLLWAMMAQSKGFSPPASMMTRIFRIIFEVASCPRKDFLMDDTSEEPTTLTKLYNDNGAVEATQGHSLLWAMLVRAEYGGMKGDIKMLRSFSNMWARRFSDPSLPAHVSEAVTKSKPRVWLDVPWALHAHAKEHSEREVLKLMQSPVNRLCRDNLCPEAIDFHCSPVIDRLMADKATVGLCHDLLLLSNPEISSSSSPSPPDALENRIKEVEALAKHCMWNHSAGVNRRLPILPLPVNEQGDKDKYKQLWIDLLEPRAAAFQVQYINQRLAS